MRNYPYEAQASLMSNEVLREVLRASTLHKPMHSLHEAKAVIEEELDEFWELVKVNPKKLSPEEQSARLKHLREELIQTAAMCVRAVLDCGLIEEGSNG